MKRCKFIYSNILPKNINKNIDNSLLTKSHILNKENILNAKQVVEVTQEQNIKKQLKSKINLT